MKQIFYVFILLISFMTVSCHKVITPEISVDVYASEMDYKGGSVAVAVTSNTSWVAACDSLHIAKIHPEEGTGNMTVTITVPENTQRETQAVRIVFTAKGEETSATAKTVITQSSAPFIDLSTTSLTYDCEGGGKQLTVTSSGAWKATTTFKDVLISPSEGAGNTNVTITAPINEVAGITRHYTVLFSLADDPNNKIELSINVNGTLLSR